MVKKLVCFDEKSLQDLAKVQAFLKLDRSKAIRVVLGEKAQGIDKLILEQLNKQDFHSKKEDILLVSNESGGVL